MNRFFILLILFPFLSGSDVPKHDTIKVKELIKTCVSLFESGDYKKIKAISVEISVLSEKTNFPKGIVEGIRWYGLSLERTGDPDSAICFYRKAIQIAHNNKLKRLEAQCWHNIGFGSYLPGSFEVAAEGYLNAIKIRK